MEETGMLLLLVVRVSLSAYEASTCEHHVAGALSRAPATLRRFTMINRHEPLDCSPPSGSWRGRLELDFERFASQLFPYLLLVGGEKRGDLFHLLLPQRVELRARFLEVPLVRLEDLPHLAAKACN